MEPPDPSFTDDFNVFYKYAVLIFDLRRAAAVSLPFQVHRLQVLVEAGLIVVPKARFEFADEGPEEAQHGSLANLPNIFARHRHDLLKVAVVGLRRVGASSLPLSVASLRSSQPPHQDPCTNVLLRAGA